MRHNNFIYLLILILSLALIGCSDGSSATNGPVKVSLAVDSSSGTAEKVVNVTVDTSVLAYYYSATPLWTSSDFTNIQGATDGYVKIPSYSEGVSIGLFAQGKWHFDVQVKLIEDGVTEANWKLVYTGSVEQYINADNNTVEVLVSKNTDENGFVTIDVIKAPTVDGDNDGTPSDKLIISYDGPASGSIAESAISISRSAGWTTFTVPATSLKAGDYIFFLTYNDGTSDVGGAVKAVSIIPGVTTNISGTIESGTWQDETFKLSTGNSLEIEISAADDKTEIPKNGSLVYTCTKVAGPEITTYSWYVNGVPQEGETSATFTLTASNYASFGYDYCYVTCVAKAVDSGVEFLASSSLILIFTE